MVEAAILTCRWLGLRPTHPSKRYGFCLRRLFMVNLPHGREIQGSLGVRSLLLKSILPLVRLNGLSVIRLYLLNPTAVSVFPDRVVGSTCASAFSRLARRSLALRPAHSRRHQFVTLFTRRLQPYRYLHDRSGCFRLEPWPGGVSTHRKAPPFHGAHPLLPVTTVGLPIR